MRNECSNGHPLRWFVGTECPDCGRDADVVEDYDHYDLEDEPTEHKAGPGVEERFVWGEDVTKYRTHCACGWDSGWRSGRRGIESAREAVARHVYEANGGTYEST